MQNVSFRDVDESLDFIPDDELRIVKLLRRMVFDCVPHISEKLSFNVPFYYKNKGMFFIWPASVLWGKKQTYEGVRFGFQQGYLLEDEPDYLERGERKQIYWKTYTGISDIDTDILKAYIFEAALLDEQFKRKRPV